MTLWQLQIDINNIDKEGLTTTNPILDWGECKIDEAKDIANKIYDKNGHNSISKTEF